MNLHFTITLTLLQLLGLCALIVVACFSLRLRRTSKLVRRIAELENEMLHCHRDILHLQHTAQLSEEDLSSQKQAARVLKLKQA